MCMCPSSRSTTCACTLLVRSLSESAVCSCEFTRWYWKLLTWDESIECFLVLHFNTAWLFLLFNSATAFFFIVKLSMKGGFIDDVGDTVNRTTYHFIASWGARLVHKVMTRSGRGMTFVFLPSFINSYKLQKYNINSHLLNTAFCSLNAVKHVYSTSLF